MAVEVASVFARIGADVSGFNSGMQSAHSDITSFSDKLTSVGQSAMKTGAIMTAGLTAPIVAFGAKAFQSAAQFETGMNVMALAASSSGTSLEQLRQAAIQVGGDTELVGINASQAAEAMTNFYKAGLQTDQIMGDMEGYLAGNASLSGALRAAIDMAAASEYDLAASSEAVSIAMATFGIKAEDATKITDIFVRAADASVASVPELNDALVNIGSTFSAFYSSTMSGTESLGQLNTALAILSQRGIKGAEAGTALKSMMTNMMRSTDKVQEAWSELGVSLYNSEGQLKQLPQIMGELEKALAGVTDQERNQYIQTLAGTYGMKAMNTLLTEGVSGWEEMEAAIGGAANTQAAAGARTKGLGAAWENLQGVIETVILQGTSPFMETVAGLVRGLADLVSRLVTLDPIWFKLAGGIALALAAAGPIVTVFGALATIAGFLVSPIGLIVAAVVALGAAWVKAQGGMGPALATLQQFGQSAIAQIGPAIASIGAKLAAMGASIQATLAPLMERIGALWLQVWPQIQNIIATVVPQVTSLIGNMAAFIGAKFQEIVAWAMANWPLIQQTVMTVVNAIAAAMPYLLGLVQVAWEQIKTAIDGVLRIIAGIIKAVMLAINGDWAGAWEQIKGVVVTIWETIKTLVTNAIAGILGVFTGAKGDFIESGTQMIAGFIEGVKKKAADLVNAAKQVVSDAIAAAKNLLGIHSPSTVFIEIGKQMMAGMGEGVSEGEAKVIEKLANAAKDLVSAFRAMLNITKDFGSPGAIPDLMPWMDRLEGMIMPVLARLQTLQDKIGYDRISKLRHVAKRLTEILEAIRFDFSQVKMGKMPDLDTYFVQYEDVFTRLMFMLARIKDKWTQKGVETAAAIAGSVAQVLQLLGTALTPGEVADNFATALDKWLAAAELATNALIEKMMALRDKWGMEVLDAAATIAQQVKTILDLLGVNLKIEAPEDGWLAALTAWLDVFVTATNELITRLTALKEAVGLDVISELAEYAASLGALWSAIASSFESLKGMIDGGGIDLAKLQTLLDQWRNAATMTGQATGQAGGNREGPNAGAAQENAPATGGGADGVIRLHIMMGDQFMQEVSLRLSQILGAQQDIYIQAGLDGAVS